ncbi:MAG: hypothetical protein KIT84_25830 [Labilithrix sp.]|nr:hypothetical protein [Labilithrix sp.]MCW5814474.1 hypothetical protein [Labilithrix sp.]
MKKITIKKVLPLVALTSTMVTGFALGGCELIVDFDRTQIDAGFIDSGVLVDADGVGDGAVVGDGDVPETSTETDAGDAGDADPQQQQDADIEDADSGD